MIYIDELTTDDKRQTVILLFINIVKLLKKVRRKNLFENSEHTIHCLFVIFSASIDLMLLEIVFGKWNGIKMC